jgi:hypothetical protein
VQAVDAALVGGAPEARVEICDGAESPEVAMVAVRRVSRPTAVTAGRIWVEVGGARVAVEAGFDPALLRQVVDALAGGRR